MQKFSAERDGGGGWGNRQSKVLPSLRVECTKKKNAKILSIVLKMALCMPLQAASKQSFSIVIITKDLNDECGKIFL